MEKRRVGVMKKSQIMVSALLLALLLIGLFIPKSSAQSIEYSKDAVRNNIIKKTHDGISVTKTASWTSVNGEERDSQGNPYININFNIDFRNADVDVINETVAQENVTTDIVLLFDFSESMTHGDPVMAVDKEIEAAKNFVNSIFDSRFFWNIHVIYNTDINEENIKIICFFTIYIARYKS